MPAPTTSNVDKLGSQLQIMQAAFDPVSQALKTTATLTFDPLVQQSVEIRAADGDTIAIADPITGSTVEVINRKLQVQTSGGSTTIPPSTDFRTATYKALATATAISFSGFTITSLSIKAISNNPGDVFIGRADVATNFYRLSPGESINLPVAASSSLVYYILPAGAPLVDHFLSVITVN